jgi:hypothetical protein
VFVLSFLFHQVKSFTSVIDLTENEQLEYALAQSMGGAHVTMDNKMEETSVIDGKFFHNKKIILIVISTQFGIQLRR